MFENPWSAVGNPTSTLSNSDSSFGPSSFALVGIHHLLLSNLTTGSEALCILVVRPFVCAYVVTEEAFSYTPTCRRLLIVGLYLRPSGVLSCWPNGLQLTPGFYPRSNDQHRLFRRLLKTYLFARY